MSAESATADLARVISARAQAMDDPLWFSVQVDLRDIARTHPLPAAVSVDDAASVAQVMHCLAVEGWQEAKGWKREQAEAYVASASLSRARDIGPS